MTHTEIICIVDRSGSMTPIKKDAIGGFNEFIKAQKNEAGTANITTVLFDHEYSVVHNNVDIQKVELLNDRTYIPRGMTALYDAIGKAINTVHGRMSENYEEPSKVICAILTDGEENDSKEYSQAGIKKLIKEMTEAHGWEFAYLGANQDSFAVAESLFIKNSLDFSGDSEGVKTAYESMSKGFSKFRSSVNYSAGSLFDEDNKGG